MASGERARIARMSVSAALNGIAARWKARAAQNRSGRSSDRGVVSMKADSGERWTNVRRPSASYSTQ